MVYDVNWLRQPQVFGGDNWGVGYSGGNSGYGGYDPSTMMGGGMDMGYDTTYQPPPIVPQGGPIPTTGGITPPQAPATPGSPERSFKDLWTQVNAAYTPDTVDQTRLRNLLDRYPEQYNPTKGDRWAAVLMGLGERSRQGGDPLGVQERILQGPRMRDIEDWKNQATPFGVAATNEANRNTQERTLLFNTLTADAAAQRNDQRMREAEMKNEVQQETNRIRNLVANGFTNITEAHDPTYKLLNKATGQVIITNSKTGSLPELDSIRERGAQSVAAMTARAGNAQEIPFEWTDPATGKKIWVVARGTQLIPMTLAQPGQRPGQQRPTTAGPGTSTPITPPPGVNVPTQSGPPANPTVDGKPISGSLRKVGDDPPVLNPTQQKQAKHLQVQNIISRHTDWAPMVYFNEETKMYEGMGKRPDPPRTAGFMGIGGRSGAKSDAEWTKYKNDMDAWNQLRAILHPEMPPEPVIGGSNAEWMAKRKKAAEDKAKGSSTSSASTTTTTAPPTGLGPSGYPSTTSSIPSTTSSVGPTTTSSRPSTTSSLPPTTTSTKSEYTDKPTPGVPSMYILGKGWKELPRTTTTTKPTTTSSIFPDVEGGSSFPMPGDPASDMVARGKSLPPNTPPYPKGASVYMNNDQFMYTTDHRTWYVLLDGKWRKVDQ